MVSVTNVKDNPSVPLAAELSYLPDQLIYDLRLVVTRSVMISDAKALKRGTVVGMITSGTLGLAGVPVAGSGNHGNGTFTSISFGEESKAGNYVMHMTGATTFVVSDPNGALLGVVASNQYGPKSGISELTATFSAGSVAMQAGDEIIIVAAPGARNVWRTCKASSTDGSQVPAGILVDDCDSTLGQLQAGVYTAGEFNGNALIVDASWTLAEISAQMEANGLHVKTPVSASDPT